MELSRDLSRVMAVGAVVIGLSIGALGCSSSSDSTAATTTTAAAANRSFQVSTDAGQVSLSLDGELPPGWPSSFPVPSGATPAGSGSLGGTSEGVMVGVFTATGTPQSTYDYYVSDAGLTVDSKKSVGVGDAYLGTVSFSGSPSGSVTVLPSGGETLIVIVLQTSGTSDTMAGSGTTLASGA
jgi:hypothetical protein